MRKIATLLLLLWPGIVLARPTCGPGVESVRYDSNLDLDFERAGREFRIDPDLGRAIALEESRFVANAISSKGATGLMQLMPDTSQTMGVRNPLDPHQNIYGGMKYLRFLADDRRFIGNPYMVLVAYGAGPNHTVFPTDAYQAADRMIATYWNLKEHRAHGTQIISAVFRAPVCGSNINLAVKPAKFDSTGRIMPTRHYLTN